MFSGKIREHSKNAKHKFDYNDLNYLRGQKVFALHMRLDAYIIFEFMSASVNGVHFEWNDQRRKPALSVSWVSWLGHFPWSKISF